MTLFEQPRARRELLIGAGMLAASRPFSALACHAPDHPPCHAGALVPLSGPLSSLGGDAAAGIRAMQAQLAIIDAERRGHLSVVIVDTSSNPDIAIARLRELVQRGQPPSAIIVADGTLPLALLARLGAEFKIPMISIFTLPATTSSDWVCRLSPSPAQIAAGMAGYLAAMGLRREEPINIVSASSTRLRAKELDLALSGVNPIGLRVELPDPAGRELAPLPQQAQKAKTGSGWFIVVPLPAAPAIVDAIRSNRGDGPIAIDGGIADPLLALQAIKAKNVAVLSPFSPELSRRRALAGAISERMLKETGHPATPAGAVAATAVQVLAEAVIEARVRDNAYGEATRNALQAVALKADDLILPWRGLSFDKSFQNQGASVVALGLRENQLATVWPPGT